MSAGVKLKMDSVEKIKLRHLINKNGQAQKFLTHEVRRLCDSYVPFDTGTLKNTAQEDVNSITYVQPYSASQYYNNTGGGKEGTSNGGKRGKLWDKRMMADRGSELVKSVANYVGGKAK